MKTCTGCSRRALLQGIGIAAIGSLVAGCAQQGSSLPAASTTSCSGGICLDLTDPKNAALTKAGGALLVDTSSDTIMVIRASATQIIAVSAICTHAGCSMDFDSGSSQLVCPCHGSSFNEDGSVIQGPARRPLKVYGATMDAQATSVTIAA